MMKKLTLSLIVMTSLMLMMIGVVSAFPLGYGIWQPDPNSGAVEWTMNQSYSGSYSAYLMAKFNYTAGSDSNEVYILPISNIPTLNDLNSMSFWYYRPSGTVGGADRVPPQIDLWIDTTGDGNDDEWLLGQIDYATTFDTWVEVTLEDITWIKATGGHIYGTGSAGLTAAKDDATYGLGAYAVQGFGVMVGSPATRDNERTMEAKYYIDDIEINGVVYDFEQPTEVYVDDDEVCGGNIPCYATIQEGINAVASGGTVNVYAGTYAPFTVDGKSNLNIVGSGVVVVEGVQSVVTAYTNRDAVVFVKDSTNIVLENLDIEGNGLGTINQKSYGVIYEASSGEIKDCIVSPNTIGNMYSTGIGIWDGSDVTVDSTTLVENFGRVGLLIYNDVTAIIEDSTIIGQVYSGEGEVSYGIEIEAAWGSADPVTASQVTIRNNEVYNCDNTFSPNPTWESGGIYINGWLEYMDEADSTVIIEDNEIHDNYVGIIVIKSPSSYAHNNEIYDNRIYGVSSLPAYDNSTFVLNAEYNWWGHITGPYHATTNPNGLGDAVSINVEYDPWCLNDECTNLGGEGSDFIALTVPDFIDYGTLYGFLGFKSQDVEIILYNVGILDIDVTPYLVEDSDPVFGDINFDDGTASGFINTFSTLILASCTGLPLECSNSLPLTTWIKLTQDLRPLKGPQTGTIYFQAVEV